MNVVVLGKGKLGSEIINQTGWDYFSRKEHNIDVVNFDEWKHKLNSYDVIVNCIANTQTYLQDRTAHWFPNYEFVTFLVEYCEENNKKLVHISTDYVYEKCNENASEEDEPSFEHLWYTYTKLLGDLYIKEQCNNYLICRTSHKPYPFPYENAWTDVYTNGDYTPVISELIIKLINNNAKGLFNVGTEKKSIFDLAKRTNKNVKPILSPINTPKNVTMNISKMENFLLHLHYDTETTRKRERGVS